MAATALEVAALDGSLNKTAMVRDSQFGFDLSTSVPNVHKAILQPRNSWADGAAYDGQADKLARMFVENFKIFAPFVDQSVRDAGPSIK